MQHRMLSKNIEERTGTCQVCGPVHLVKRRNSLVCGTKANSRDRERFSRNSKRARYGKELAEQGGRCAICNEHMSKPHWDHDHVTNEFRGWLCFRCNVGLGQFRDDPALLSAAIDYLSRPCYN